MKNTSGKLIEARRKQLGMSQQKMADLIPCSQALIVKWEKGSIPDVEKGMRLQDVLGIKLENIFFADDDYALPDAHIREVEQSQSAIFKLHKETQVVIILMEKETDNIGREKIVSAAKEVIELRQAHLRLTKQEINQQINELNEISNDAQVSYAASSLPRAIQK